MSIPRINIIGAGRLGKTLGHLLAKHQLVQVLGVVNRSLESSLAAVQFIGQGQAYADLALLPSADITLITTPDNVLFQWGERWLATGKVEPGQGLVHCSGVLPAAIWVSARQRQCDVASWHPLHSFAAPEKSINSFAGTFCVVEGDASLVTVLANWIICLQGKLLPIHSDKKAVYHAGSVFAANYLVTLAAAAERSFSVAGLTQEQSRALTLSLMKNVLENMTHEKSLRKVLTGPLQRGDDGTLRQHKQALSEIDLESLYDYLTMYTQQLLLSDGKNERK